ncbi:uncharacterized protein LOC119987743 [Tripterygium wilfordii]|uniref:uncharacterized protein LOC119987743 n=1 Tax=Tripterygium wilfordii TaxID=458696 RepID=UPI0018F837D4|nr:uncharacterized protein LOC119987743 [Tripterygium wilfordii]
MHSTEDGSISQNEWDGYYLNFPGHRYNIMTINIAECLNGILRDVQNLPIAKLMDHLQDRARVMTMEPISINTFLVKDGDVGGQVDLASRTCSCRFFDLDQITCVHAFAACKVRKLPTISLWSPYYRTDMFLLAYAEPINPILSTDTNVLIEEVRVLLPPATRRKSGRPRKR